MQSGGSSCLRTACLEDERYLFGNIIRLAEEVSIPLLFLENVRAFSSAKGTAQPQSQTLLGSWPKRGLMLHGSVYQLPKPVRPISVKDFSASHGAQSQRLWLTPVKTDSKFCHKTGDFANIVSQTQALSDGSITNRLNADWLETLMGWTADAENKALRFPGFPKGHGASQHDQEPLRIVQKADTTNRAKRVAMIGNGVCPQQAALAYNCLLGNLSV